MKLEREKIKVGKIIDTFEEEGRCQNYRKFAQ